MAELSAFSDWTLALLSRLFIYPGGLWMLIALLWLRLAVGMSTEYRVPSTEGRVLPTTNSVLGTRYSVLVRANLPALAAGWAALALLPLPGVALLPVPCDRFSLAALIVVSLALDSRDREEWGWTETSLSVAITLAAMTPVAGGKGLFIREPGIGLADWLSASAVVAGLVGLLPGAARDLSGAVRWLAWLGLGIAPLWGIQPAVLLGVYWVSLVYLVAVAILAGLGLAARRRGGTGTISLIAWSLALASLVAALLLAG